MSFLLNGPGGTGKTYLYNYIITVCKARQIKFSSSAWVGIAATLLEGGQTCHSTFKLPVPCLDGAKCNVSPSSLYAEQLRNTTVFIIDEVSMMNRFALDALDVMLRDICSNDIAFGGKIMIFGGDFRQTLPIVKYGGEDQILQACVVSSPLWKLCQHFALTVNMRAKKGEQEFAQFLLDLGSNALPIRQHAPYNGCIQIPSICITNESLSDLIFPSALTSKLASYAVAIAKV